MNTKNNKRRRESVRKIENVFIELLQTNEISDISVSQVCKLADVNRSTFYANYMDIYDLAEKVTERLVKEVRLLYVGDDRIQRLSFLKIFNHIYENQSIYKTYFKLHDFDFNEFGYDKEIAAMFFDMKYIDYHIEFFKSGLNAIIKKWLQEGCKEPPAVMDEILISEYKRDYSMFNQE